MILIGLGVLLLIGLIIYVLNTSSFSTASLYTLTYEDKVLYKGNVRPVFSSDSTERVLFRKDDGLYEVSIDNGEPRKLSDIVPTGLAYDGTDFMMLNSDQTLFAVGQDGTVTEIGSGYNELYDTVDGYFLAGSGGGAVTGESGSKKRNNGNYGIIKLTLS